jgi:hypothetical protein
MASSLRQTFRPPLRAAWCRSDAQPGPKIVVLPLIGIVSVEQGEGLANGSRLYRNEGGLL